MKQNVWESMYDTIATWGQYVFTVGSPGTEFCDFPGVFLFAGWNADAGWDPVYVAWTQSLQDSLYEHWLWEKAARCGATHIHAMPVQSESEGRSIANTLIEEFEPWFNSPRA